MMFVIPDAHWHWECDDRFTEGQRVVKSGGWHVVTQPKLNAHRREVRLLQFCSRVELPVETGIP
jgi:hypothetical protein